MKRARSVFSLRSSTLSRHFERIRKGAANSKEISHTSQILKYIMRIYYTNDDVFFLMPCACFFTRIPTSNLVKPYTIE